MAVCLFQVREFLSKLEELVGKVSYDNDPVKTQRPALQKRTDTLLKDLIKRFLRHCSSCSLALSWCPFKIS